MFVVFRSGPESWTDPSCRHSNLAVTEMAEQLLYRDVDQDPFGSCGETLEGGTLISEEQPILPYDTAGFHCIGSICEDTCCNGLNVPLQKETYERYKSLPDGHLRSLADQYVVINNVKGSDNLYAKIAMTPSRTCVFLSTERLCSLQKELGPEYLSATCAIYPRVRNEINGKLETSLHLSCPEAARLVLLSPPAGELDLDTPSVQQADQFSALNSEVTPSTHMPHRDLQEIRSFVIELLQERTYTLWQRMFLLALVCDRLDKLSFAEQEEGVPQILRIYRDLIAIGALRGVLHGVPSQPAVRLDTVLRLADLCVRANANNKRFVDCLQIFLQGIGYSAESEQESDTQHYVEVEDRYYRPFLQAHESLLENYLIHYVFKNLFPFGRRASSYYTPQGIFTEYELLAAHYVLVNGLLTGMAGYYETAFNVGHVVKLVQSLSKTMEHSPALLRDIAQFIQSRDPKRIKGIAVLLRS
jgi:lysine-N-methylase